MDAKTIESWDLSYRGVNDRARLSDDCELYYEVEGSASWPCLTFVSTIYVISTAWRNFTREIATANRVLTYDLRNQGASIGPPAGFNQHTDDLLQLLDHLDIDRTYLVGTSISTLICADFAVRYPGRVQGLVLVGPPFSPWGSKRRTRIMGSWLAALESGGPRQLFDLMYPLVFGDRDQATGGTAAYIALRERFLAINSAAQLKSSLREAIENPASDSQLLANINAPVLLLGGDDDFCISPSAVSALAEQIPDATAEIYEGCGHLPFFEQTARFEQSVSEFVKSVEER
ncbi:MAG: alpha/beta hydrolase [Mycobacterium sp.]|nr:MAG: alpha/beta hydrolase [Mycobacterium sp.]